MPSAVHLFLALLLCVALTDALKTDYLHGPIKISNEGRVWYTGNATAGEVLICLSLTLQPSTKPMWVGLGLAPPGSAGMRGASLFTAQFPAGNNTNCTAVQARAAPFIGTSRLGLSADIIAPVLVGMENESDNHGWKLRECSRNSNGTFSLEVTRKLGSTENASYSDTVTSFLHAYGTGSTVSYHAKTKFSTALNFFRAPLGVPPPFATDYSGTFSFKSPALPALKATNRMNSSLTCYTGMFSAPSVAKMVVAMEAVVKSGAPDISRLMVYGCKPSAYFAANNLPKLEAQCASEYYSSGINTAAHCGTLFYSWAPGVGRLSFPEEAGIFLSALNRQILVEVTFASTIFIPASISASTSAGTAGATSGRGYKPDDIEIKFHYTDTARKYRVGTMAAGDAAHRWVTRPTLNITVACTDRCTQELSEPINIFAVHTHLGRYGLKAEVSISRESISSGSNNSSFNFTTVDSIPYWASGHERYSDLSPSPVVLNPGDRLVTTCNYNLDRLVLDPRAPINFLPYGRNVNSEQCDSWMFYYPAQYRFDPDEDGDLFYCAQRVNDAGLPAMICGPGWRGDRAMVQFRQNEPACFAADAKVTVRNGKYKYMKDLVVGDEVLVDRNGQYSRVYMFTHADRHAISKFVVLHFPDGTTFAASPDHFLYCADGKLIRADEVEVGNTLHTLQQGRIVVEISREERVGLYNPQTLQGDIVVDGVIASTYTSTVAPTVGHALLAPTRLAYSFLASDTSRLACGLLGRGFLLRIRQVARAVLSAVVSVDVA